MLTSFSESSKAYRSGAKTSLSKTRLPAYGIAKYAGRATRQLFYAISVNPDFIRSKAAAMSIYEYITSEMLPRDAGKARDYATRVAELALTKQISTSFKIFES